jgi:hypothetical protein
MGSVEVHPGSNLLADELLSPQLFGVDPPLLGKDAYGKAPGRKSRPVAPRRAGQKLLLEAKDFVLPELVKHADNGDLSVSIAPSTDAVQVEQILHLAECGEEITPSFSDLPYAEQQLEKRRYLDYLKRVPKREIQGAIRREDLETWRRGGDEAESNFLTWWERKQWRKRSALLRKANRLANCGVSGRRLDCSGHAGHQFYAGFNCQSRYCRRCGADVFAELFGKYVGLWPTVLRLLPPRGFRSSTIIAQLDFTAVNLERMPLPAEIREFNQDIRECMKRVCREMGLRADGYGFLWCDEFGGWNPKKNSYNTNLHAHGVYVGPYIPQELIARHWAEIRSEKDGAKVVWISKQKIDHAPGDFHEGERRRFIRALGHALKYTGKHVSRSDGERLAQLEVAFQGVRRVHTMGLFYHADLRCREQCGDCNGRCELVSGHQGDHHCKYHGHGNRCPLCDGHLMFPRDSGYARVSDLRKEGRRELAEVRRQVSRDRVLHGPREPDA